RMRCESAPLAGARHGETISVLLIIDPPAFAHNLLAASQTNSVRRFANNRAHLAGPVGISRSPHGAESHRWLVGCFPRATRTSPSADDLRLVILLHRQRRLPHIPRHRFSRGLRVALSKTSAASRVAPA